jgi:hypothetical protein
MPRRPPRGTKGVGGSEDDDGAWSPTPFVIILFFLVLTLGLGVACLVVRTTGG